MTLPSNNQADKLNSSTQEVVDTGFEAGYCHSAKKSADTWNIALKVSTQE